LRELPLFSLKSTTDMGRIISRGVLTRKAIAFTITIAAVCFMLNTVVSAATINGISSEDYERVLLRLLSDAAHDAIEKYYGEPRQYLDDTILSIRTIPDTSYYEVVMQAETFYGPHNPPYGIETMTFYISYGKVELKKYEHQDKPG
jgi:hypothetical protein